MNITFYKFGKPNNSTAIPGNTVVKWETTGQLKADSTINSPEIVLVGRDDISEFNYAYIPSFGRYYHVTECAWLSGRWSLSLACDPLASFRSQILTSSQYVLRSASESDNMVIDSMYPTKTQTTATSNRVGLRFSEAGCFIIGCIGEAGSATGGINYYALTPAQMSAVITYLYTSDGYEYLTDIAKFNFNPIQYVVSCKWFPFADMHGIGSDTNVRFGWWNARDLAARTVHPWYDINGTRRDDHISVTIPKHPEGGYMNGNTFSKYHLILPGAGETALDADVMAGLSILNIKAYVDPVTGGITYKVYFGSTDYILIQGQIGVDVQLSQVLTNPLSAVQTGLEAASAFTKLDIFGGINKSINATLEAAIPSVSKMSSNGDRTISAYSDGICLRAEFYHQTDKNNTLYGSPLCATRTLSSLSGYTVCGNPQISLVGATAGEQADVISALSEGVIIA